MKSRGAAVIAAFVLIALAIFVRGLLVDGDEGSGGSDGPKKGTDGGTPVVACTPDLITVCDALADAGQIADDPPELDLDDASAPDEDIDGWITWNPAPALANFQAGDPRVWATPTVLGAARESVLVDETTAAAIPAACRTSPTWSCLADLAPALSIGVGEPGTAEGIARLAPFAQVFATDDDYTTLDTAGLEALVRSTAQKPAADMAKSMGQPGFVSMTAGPAALLDRQSATPQGKARGLQVLDPKQVNGLTVVLAPRAGQDDSVGDLACTSDGELSDRAAAALEQLGLTTCTGRATDALAGFLFQVQKKVG